MTDSTERARKVAAGLTPSQRWFIQALSSSWVYPGEIGAKTNHGGHRDPRLVEVGADGKGRKYRLTPAGLAVRRILEANNPAHP